MSFSFGDSSINQFKAQSAYKDGSGMGGGGMYFQQRQKKKDEEEQDIFESSKDERNIDEIDFSEPDDKDIPQETFYNKVVNWFRLKKD